ncbi:MAG: YdeI/OmpD-associated family protein [Cytophagaceae bacterium]
MKDKRVDEYIENANPELQPILHHFRGLVHQLSPEIIETIKWGFPNFEYKGPLFSMAAFKNHCAFTIHKASVLEDKHGLLEMVGKTAMGQFGKIASLKDLPSDEILKDYLRAAIQVNEQGVKPAKKSPSEKELPDSPHFFEALNDDAEALRNYEAFSYSNKKDYLAWINEAKTEATRDKRIATAIEWLREGKTRHWKYRK